MNALVAAAAAALVLFAGRPLLADPPRELSVGISGEEFQKEFDRQTGNGLRPLDVAVCAAGRRITVSMLWERRLRPAFKMRAGMSRDELKQQITDAGKDGFRLIDLAGIALGETELYAAIWDKEKEPGPQLTVRYGYPLAEFRKVHKELASAGNAIICLTALEEDRKVRFTAAWEKQETPSRELELDLSEPRLEKALRDRSKKGERLVAVCPYSSGRFVRYACVWEKSAGPEQQVQLSLTAAALKRLEPAMAEKGLRPAHITAFAAGGQDRYAVIWEEAGNNGEK